MMTRIISKFTGQIVPDRIYIVQYSSDERDCILDLANAAIKCRAIAEEGAGDGCSL